MAVNPTTLITPPSDPKSPLLAERERVATPNMTAAGAVAPVGEARAGGVDAAGRFGTDESGRIFLLPPSGQSNAPTPSNLGQGASGQPGTGLSSSGGGTSLVAPPGAFGVNLTPPKPPERPDTSGLDRSIADLRSQMVTPQQIEQGLQSELASIESRYQADESTLLSDMESEKQAAFSDLAGIGVGINPLSSAGQSLSNAANIRKDRAVSNLRALKAAEVSKARALAEGRKTDAIDRQIKAIEADRDRMTTEANESYNRLRQHFDDTVKALNVAATLARESRELTSAERSDALGRVNDFFDLMGAKAFDGVDPDSIADLERAAGLPVNSISIAKNKLREDEARAQAEQNRGELRTVGKKVFQIQYDKDGNAVPRLVTEEAGSGGGSGSGSGNGAGSTGGAGSLSYDEFLKVYGEENKITPDPNSPALRSLYVDALNDPAIQAALGGGGASETASDGVSDKDLLKTLSPEDKKRMIATGMNPANAAQVRTYLQGQYIPKDEKKSSGPKPMF